MPTIKTISTDLEGVTIELQSVIGSLDGGVLHVLPGGTKNAEGFGGDIGDVYAFTAVGKNTFRGGHYHHQLTELFLPMSGTALWLLSDFRENSPTKGKTIGIVLGINALPEPSPLPTHVLTDGSLPRLRVPAGVYHAVFPLTDERMLVSALGSIGYDKNDYAYPQLQDIPEAEAILARHGIAVPVRA